MMKPILLIVAVVAAGGGLYWGLELKSELEKTVAENMACKEENKQRGVVLADAEKTRDEAQKSRDMAVQAQSEAKSRYNSEQDSNVQLESELASTEGELAALNKKLEDLMGTQDSRDPDAMMAQIEELQQSLAQKRSRAEELKTVLQAAEGKVATLSTENQRYQERRAKYVAEVSRNAVEYAITAIDPRWGFVVFNAGEGSGVDPTQPMLVFRNGQRIAMLKITSVDKNQTVADIIPASIKPGQRLEVGDKVILRLPQG